MTKRHKWNGKIVQMNPRPTNLALETSTTHWPMKWTRINFAEASSVPNEKKSPKIISHNPWLAEEAAVHLVVQGATKNVLYFENGFKKISLF